MNGPIADLANHAREHTTPVADCDWCPLPTAADQPTTEPSEAGLRIEHGWLVEETTGCTCAGGTEESSYLHEPGCGLTPLQRLDDLPGWPLAPAPQPDADTETEVQWGVRYDEGGQVIDTPMENEEHARSLARIVDATVVHRTVTRTPWEEA